jgi:nucleoside-diphosphate-sugar epimerase
MKYLVTGAAGFIGSHLCQNLISLGNQVTGIDSFTDYYPRWIKDKNIETCLKDPAFRFIQADLNQADLHNLLAGMDGVFHLAAQAGVRASWGKSFQAYIDSNIRATQRILEAVKDRGEPRMVFASSSSVYGKTDELPIRETASKNPLSPYGATKLACEALCNLYHANFGVDVIQLRYFTVYGPRQRPDMAFHIFFKAILENQPVRIFGDGDQTRDFTYISDILAATIKAMEKGVPGRIYNIGGGHCRRLNEVVEKIFECAGRDTRVVFEQKQKGDVPDTFADTSLAKNELGFEPGADLLDGLKAEWNWIRELYSREK